MRISRDQMFMGVARIASQRSTCFRLNVGAVIVVDNNIVSIGYNGPASGEEHCTGNECCLPGAGCHRSIHAEANALRRIPQGLSSWTKTLYVTHSPCRHCAKLLIDTMNLKTIIFEAEYRNTDHLWELTSNGIKLLRLTPSGYLVEHWTNRIVE